VGIENVNLFDWLREGANVLVLAMDGGAADGRQVKRATVVRIADGVVTTDDRREFSASTLQRTDGELFAPSEILASMADPEARTLLFMEESRELEAEVEEARGLLASPPRGEASLAHLADVRKRLVDVLGEFVAEVAPLFALGDQCDQGR
jgi:hypothetical protein